MEAQICHDRPLKKADALKHDKLSRTGFATMAVKALRQLSSHSGFVLSVEGEWGSGKTSALALMDALLSDRQVFPADPIVVHFNPWLVGDRDALLRQFLNAIASKLELTDNAGVGKRIAKELKAYGKVFDVLKLIPGAEPWVSIVKSAGDVFGAVSGATEAISDYKTPDLEARRATVADALREFDRPIVVFIDDIDRLFPAEVFEMVRIVKAVGDLPNVGYVLAWDSAYVCDALRAAKVPKAESYLDKIVQIRLPLPKLSISAKGRLVDEAINALDPEALKWHFKDDERRLSSLYFSGLRDLLEQPRDILRVFNTVGLLEPGLRGEISLADVVGLAALKVKAPEVFELVRKNPRYFVGRLPGDTMLAKTKDLVEKGAEPRQMALNACSAPDAVRRVLHFLFPLVANTDKGYATDRVEAAEGHVASPERLYVALQHSISPLDVSLVAVRRYLVDPASRPFVLAQLTPDNCHEFLGAIADVARAIKGIGITDMPELCLALAQTIETEPFLQASKRGISMFAMNPSTVCRSTIAAVIEVAPSNNEQAIWSNIARDRMALSLAADVIADRRNGALNDCKDVDGALAEHSGMGDIDTYAINVQQAAQEGRLFKSPTSGYLLWRLAAWKPEACAAVMNTIKMVDPTMDHFALSFLNHSHDSFKGQTFSLPEDIQRLEAFMPLDVFKEHARKRLEDAQVDYPLRAAWRAAFEGKKLYAVDGTDASR
ncbi:MAG: hypothetical protein EOO15_17790 [Chitinophagaceae bacterium]|nr:MAG: hypothetical protein EOO15_17790 [Chitinophagaceae bacterium]